ncbi:MAG: DUF1993 domain-containing protein [Hyphomonadaceae bacterium]
MSELYDYTVPTFCQILTSLLTVLDKTEKHCAEKKIDCSAIIEDRLIADMLPFQFQIRNAVEQSAGAVARVLGGAPHPALEARDMAGLKAGVADAIEALGAVRPEALNALAEKEIPFQLPNRFLLFRAKDYLNGYTTPHFFFHATTAYGIARKNGVPVGKRDYMGVLRLIGGGP